MKILHLEDSPCDAELTHAGLREVWPDCEIQVVSDSRDFQAALGAVPDVILSDFNIPGYNGLDALRHARAAVPGVPFIFLSGTIGEHGMAVMLARGDLAIDADIASDTAPLHELVEILLAAAPSTRWMRDATRGGVGTVCNELVKERPFAVVLDEARLPMEPQVLGACDLLGIDPLYVANEGKFLAVVPPDQADAAVAALRAHPLGARAAIVGEIIPEPHGIVALRTSFGGTRIVDMLVGDPLPRIC